MRNSELIRWSDTVNEQRQIEKLGRPVRRVAHQELRRISVAMWRRDKCRMSILYVNIRHECPDPRSGPGPSFLQGERGTARYAVNAPVFGLVALPVISPLLFMSLALVSTAVKPGTLRSFRSVGVLP